MRNIIFLLVGFLLLSCAASRTLTREEADYVLAVKRFPLEFEITKDEADEAWGRAQSFIGKYSSMKLQTVTDYVIQTYNPGSTDYKFGYYVTKTPLGDNTQFSIQCICNNWFAGDDRNRNAHILAWYIKTGELPYPHLIRQ